jgi:hypothetical protein
MLRPEAREAHDDTSAPLPASRSQFRAGAGARALDARAPRRLCGSYFATRSAAIRDEPQYAMEILGPAREGYL